MTSVLALTDGFVQTIMDGVAVVGQVIVYSNVFVIEGDEYFSVFLKASSSTGTPHFKITRCYNFSTQGDPETDKWAEIEIDGSEDVLIGDFEKKVWTVNAEHPKYSIWMKYKITGLVTNSGDSTLSMVIVKQRK